MKKFIVSSVVVVVVSNDIFCGCCNKKEGIKKIESLDVSKIGSDSNFIKLDEGNLEEVLNKSFSPDIEKKVRALCKKKLGKNFDETQEWTSVAPIDIGNGKLQCTEFLCFDDVEGIEQYKFEIEGCDAIEDKLSDLCKLTLLSGKKYSFVLLQKLKGKGKNQTSAKLFKKS